VDAADGWYYALGIVATALILLRAAAPGTGFKVDGAHHRPRSVT
jgi:hypothetical protein